MKKNLVKPLLSPRQYAFEIIKNLGISLAIIGFSLGLGVMGYHYYGNLSWIDSLLNASMILSGMGPVNELHTFSAKLFSSFYALFSGVVFITSVAVLLTPIVHRFLHKFHLEKEAEHANDS